MYVPMTQNIINRCDKVELVVTSSILLTFKQLQPVYSFSEQKLNYSFITKKGKILTL